MKKTFKKRFTVQKNKVIKSIFLLDYLIDENRNRENRNRKRLHMEQKRRLLNEYQLTKYLTQKMKKELAIELNLPQVTVKVSSQTLN